MPANEVYSFTVNGKEVSTNEDKPLLRFLRDDLKLFSVKDGCAQGACGTCTSTNWPGAMGGKVPARGVSFSNT